MKNLLNLGKALNKAEQKQIFGGINRLKRKDDPSDCDNGPFGCCTEDMDCKKYSGNSTTNGSYIYGTCASNGFCYY